MSESVTKIFQVLFAQYIHLLAIRTPRHGKHNASMFVF
jgi:hypothetical protein